MLDPFADFDPYGGAPEPETLTGSLLVAAPRLVDPHFARRVVLVLDHGDHGAIGVVLDDAGAAPVGELLPAWGELAAPPGTVFVGGPVQRNAVIGLARLTAPPAAVEPPAGWRSLLDDPRPVGTLDLEAGPQAGVGSIESVRLFSGYAGWETGQVEHEIREGSWYVVPARAADAVGADPEGLWRRVLRRQGGALALVSGYPPEPSVN